MKTLVITGSTRGIGRGLAESFLAQGCKVVVNGRSQEAVERAVGELAAGSEAARVAGCAGDVSRHEDLEALWRCAAAAFGRVDVWINNAGISIHRAPLWEQPAADLEAIVNTNLTGMLLANKVALAGEGAGRRPNLEHGGLRQQRHGAAPAWPPMAPPSGLSITSTRRCARTPPAPVCRSAPSAPASWSPTSWSATTTWIRSSGAKPSACSTFWATPWKPWRPTWSEASSRRTGRRQGRMADHGQGMRRFLAAPFRKRELFADLPC